MGMTVSDTECVCYLSCENHWLGNIGHIVKMSFCLAKEHRFYGLNCL